MKSVEHIVLLTPGFAHKNKPKINAGLLLVFAVLSFLGALHHEMWFDEMQAWLISKDSHSFSELLTNSKYESHPMIWHTMLFVLSAFTHNPFAVQMLHLSIILATAFLFLRYSPFSVLQNVCILFGYYFFFEYNVISRSYSLTLLFLVLFSALFSSPKNNYLAQTLCLVALANTHLLSFIISIPLFLLLSHDYLRNTGVTNKKTYILFLGLFISGLAVAVLSILPPSDSLLLNNVKGNIFTSDRFIKAFSFYLKGIYPMPDFSNFHFWNYHFMVSHLKHMGIVLSVLVFIVPFILFFDKPASLFIFYSLTLLIAAGSFLMNLVTGAHYMGYMFMILLVSLWLSKTNHISVRIPLFSKWEALLEKIRTGVYKPFLWSILLCQIVSGIGAYCKDNRCTFSKGNEVSAWIQGFGEKHKLIVVNPYNSGPVVSGYLGEPVFYPELNHLGSFCVWNRLALVTPADLAVRIKSCMDSSAEAHVYIVLAFSTDNSKLMNLLMASLSRDQYTLKEVREFRPAIVEREEYWACRIDKIR